MTDLSVTTLNSGFYFIYYISMCIFKMNFHHEGIMYSLYNNNNTNHNTLYYEKLNTIILKAQKKILLITQIELICTNNRFKLEELEFLIIDILLLQDLNCTNPTNQKKGL